VKARSGTGASSSNWVLACEHASCSLPRAYGTLGLGRADLRDHIGWDVGAAAVMREAARRLDAPCVASRWSRLLIDCNRDAADPSLIVARSDGREIPGNARLTRRERERRLAEYYAPYHEALDRVIRRALTRGGDVRLLSVHSFTPCLQDGRPRPFDIGVLFDRHVPLARRLGSALRKLGYAVRYNEPYSGLAGLIYSARRHGDGNGIPYVELEINNGLLRDPAGTKRLGRDVAKALESIAVK
jgi:predicted N-formylglutamate amidohydrolase